LATVNFFLFCVGGAQVTRIYFYNQSLTNSTAGEEIKSAAKEEGSIVEGIVKDPEAALKKAVNVK